ncbi:hypothetical protein R1CP_39155 (plasmid) [Rhodococcus opacus]|uniref:Uncharacterized protein n=1 Tax=Rhodococcus opacus TaxID=37919 RepID=A0A1B1KI79_RHOOP|nr:hypothetical protein R1CP_38650 [Rhodococcus opacus]ANS32415.1 hypothetical protein R1CP_39155 [Rhodococcus opacus]
MLHEVVAWRSQYTAKIMKHYVRALRSAAFDGAIGICWDNADAGNL